MTFLGFALTFGVLALFLLIAYRQVRRVDATIAESDARKTQAEQGGHDE
ncbi:hypothetical protein BH23ACT10_BH23ACT10_29430 [soil metagenome]